MLLAINIVISFLRGQLINHDTPLALHVSGRTLFAPEVRLALSADALAWTGFTGSTELNYKRPGKSRKVSRFAVLGVVRQQRR